MYQNRFKSILCEEDSYCGVCKVEQQALVAKARGSNLGLAKSLICYWGAEELGVSPNEMGLKLQISQQAVPKWVKKGRAYCRSEGIAFDDLIS